MHCVAHSQYLQEILWTYPQNPHSCNFLWSTNQLHSFNFYLYVTIDFGVHVNIIVFYLVSIYYYTINIYIFLFVFYLILVSFRLHSVCFTFFSHFYLFLSLYKYKFISLISFCLSIYNECMYVTEYIYISQVASNQ